jgi:hypothetical protein
LGKCLQLANCIQGFGVRVRVRGKVGRQDSLVGIALDSQAERYSQGSILASTTKGAQLERLIISPCEIIKIC